MELFDFEGLPSVVAVRPVQDVPEGWGAIYIIMNTINGKLYVGQTWVGVLERWKGHLRDSREQYLGNAIRKYGKENFILGLLDATETQEELDRLETFWILTLHSANPEIGYNLTYGGRSGGKHSPQLRERHSKRMKEAWTDPDFREKMLEGQAKMRDDPDFRENLSAGTSAYWNSSEGKEKRSALMTDCWKNPAYREGMLSRMQSEESKMEVSRKSKDSWNNPDSRKRRMAGISNPESRAKISAAQKRAWSSPISKEKASQTSKTLWENPEFRGKITAHRNTPEYKEEVSKQVKARWTDPVWRAKTIAAMKASHAKKKEQIQDSLDNMAKS